MIERGILYIADVTSNKVRQHILTLLKYLNRARYKPYIVISDDSQIGDQLRSLKIDYIVVPEMLTANKISVSAVAKQIQEFAEDKTINLIHSHDYQACFVGAQAAKLMNIPHLSTIHSMTGLDTKKKGLLNVSNDKIVSLPNRLIATSDDAVSKLEPLNDVKLIYNGVETERFAETTDTEHLYHELNLPKESQIIGTITNLTQDDGVDIFLDAAKILFERNPLNHFVIVGTGPETDNFKAKVEEAGMKSNVHFLGFRRDIAHILKSFSVVVIPGINPGLPLVLLEALASTKPVVATDVPGVREAIKAECISLVKPGIAEAIADAVGDLLNDAISATKMATEGQKALMEKFTVDHMLKPTQSLYLEIAG